MPSPFDLVKNVNYSMAQNCLAILVFIGSPTLSSILNAGSRYFRNDFPCKTAIFTGIFISYLYF